MTYIRLCSASSRYACFIMPTIALRSSSLTRGPPCFSALSANRSGVIERDEDRDVRDMDTDDARRIDCARGIDDHEGDDREAGRSKRNAE